MAFSAMAAAMVGSTAYSAYSANQQKQQAKGVAYRAEQDARKQEKAMEQQLNATNQKRPNTRAMLDSATQSARAGQSGTMLTGPQGVDPNAMTLGRTTLLGGG